MLLNPLDWLALGWFVAAWVGYDRFSEHWSRTRPSLLEHMNHHRHEWMLQLTYRDNRIADVAAMANLSSSPTFFASTTIIIIGGLLAMLGSLVEAVKVMSNLPFIKEAPEAVWEVKVVLLAGVFVFAFFRFTWALRLFNFCAILISSAPLHTSFEAGEEDRKRYAKKVGKLIALAGESFNDGLRAYYFAIASLTFFVHPLAFMAATASVVFILYHREFHSLELRTLIESD
jgi:uncharacterized membrane protein